MGPPIRPQRDWESSREPWWRRSALGAKLTVLLALFVLFLIVFVTGLLRGLG